MSKTVGSYRKDTVDLRTQGRRVEASDVAAQPVCPEGSPADYPAPPPPAVQAPGSSALDDALQRLRREWPDADGQARAGRPDPDRDA